MTSLSEDLVGRAAELGSLEWSLDEVEQGRPVVLELVGEPGIGKTRLVSELARRATDRGYLVLSGSASELERDLPFWVFVDALEEYVRGLEPRWLDYMDDIARSELGFVFPGLAAVGSPAAAPRDERYRAHRAVRELLDLLAVRQPLVLTLDDAHWADAASIELLGALLRRPPAAGVLLALAVRPRQAPARLSAALDLAYRRDALTRIELGALSRDEAADLLGAAVGSQTVSELFEESGGNPFYLQQLARPRDRSRSGATDAAPLS